MVDSIRALTEAIEVLEDEPRVVELAARALWEACPRGTAFAATARGGQLATVRMCRDGTSAAFAIPHVAYVKTPAFDVANVPVDQRNRWVEPFREGIATREGFRRSTIYPVVAHLGIADQGRLAVCSAERQVAIALLGVPEGADFTEPERARLTESALELVVPLRASALLAAARSKQTALDALLASTDDAVLATDGRGAIVGTSRAAFVALRETASLADAIRTAVRTTRSPQRVRIGTTTLHLSPCDDHALPGGWLVALDHFAEPPRALTARQELLLEHLAKGLTNAEIATAMTIAPATVKTMLERLYRLADVGNRVELLAWARARAPHRG